MEASGVCTSSEGHSVSKSACIGMEEETDEHLYTGVPQGLGNGWQCTHVACPPARTLLITNP